MAFTEINSSSTSLTLSFWRRCDNLNVVDRVAVRADHTSRAGKEKCGGRDADHVYSEGYGQEMDTQHCVLTLQHGEVQESDCC